MNHLSSLNLSWLIYVIFFEQIVKHCFLEFFTRVEVGESLLKKFFRLSFIQRTRLICVVSVPNIGDYAVNILLLPITDQIFNFKLILNLIIDYFGDNFYTIVVLHLCAFLERHFTLLFNFARHFMNKLYHFFFVDPASVVCIKLFK